MIRRGRHRRRAAVALLVVTLACAALFAAAASSKGRPARPLYWGAVIGSQLTGEAAPWDMRAVFKFERLARKRLSLLAFSSPFADCSVPGCAFFPFPTAVMEGIRKHGTIPLLTWASQSVPSSLNEPDFRLSRIAHGAFDSYIREFAEAAREWGHPFFLRLNPEMNGFWFPWSEGVNGNRPGQFVAAWRHIHDIFTSVGATKVTWVWCPNIDFNRDLTPLRRLYPGNAYVDWTCLDGFNWGRTPSSAGWMTFKQIFDSTYRRIVRIAPHKPMVIGEVASDNRGGSKAAWIHNMLHIVPSRYRGVRGLIWYDQNDQGMHWPIESSRAATQAFAQGISRKVYRPNLYANLPDGPIQPPSW